MEFKNIIKIINKTILNEDFWENGLVMIIFSIIFGLIFELLTWSISRRYQIKNIIFIPSLLCLIIMSFGIIMLSFPNGTGGVTQHFYLGIIMYSLSILIVTLIIGLVILLLKK